MTLGTFDSELRGLEHEFFGGVGDDSIRRASELIGFTFPPSYYEFLRRFGSGYISCQELIGLGGPPHLDVVKQTLLLRENSRTSRFQRQLVPILADGFGNYECLDLSSGYPSRERPVVQWLHDGGDEQLLNRLAPSYAQWLRALVDRIRSAEMSDRAWESFQYWLADMDSALERFLEQLPPAIVPQLDFSPESLDSLEAWILARFPSTQAMLSPTESRVVDGLARYIGETFRKAIGGKWEIRLDDPKYVFHGRPQLTGFSERPTPVAPISLATAAADRRTGTFLGSVLGSYIRDKKAR